MFFWKPADGHGWGSQWYYAPFKARIVIELDSRIVADSGEEVEFLTCEHWMMACKALVFSDTEVYNKVLGTGAEDMRAVKALGREVKNFDDQVWKQVRYDIVVKGNMEKFKQDEELKRILLDTGEREIVEASPRDRIWGIGFGEKRALTVKGQWGLNLLGKALMDVRRSLRAQL